MTGLTTEEATYLYSRGKGNVQIDSTAKTTKDIVRENVLTYFNLIFAILAILLIAAGAFNSLTFLPVVIANALIGIFQGLNSKKVLDNLKVLNQSKAQVIRDGDEKTIAIDKLVQGDIIVLTAGNQICADAVVVDGEIAVNEALLTGEADEIVKNKGKKLMSGSFVVSGKCYAKLTKVGADSYISKLTMKAKKMPSKNNSIMVKSINGIVVAAGIVIVPIGIALFYQSYIIQRLTFSKSVVSMVAAVIGMIPEGLYLLLSITLAMSATKLARHKVMLHDMRSVETLARVDTICVDKTGTITDNSMLVADVMAAPGVGDTELEEYKETIRNYIGVLPDTNLTMDALSDYFVENMSATCISFRSFSSKFKYSSVQFNSATYVMGAPEFVLKSNYDEYADIITEKASRGLRVLVFGKYMGDVENPSEIQTPAEGDLEGKLVIPLVFILLQNPVRENAADTFEFFEKQGVEVKVISGDNALTVSEVAKKARISGAEKYIDASTLKNDDDIRDAVSKYNVFGRVTPEQKQSIVRFLKKQGRTVAMTGDGVNDILAMKDSDCSIAMAAGSEAAMQAAQVVLLDSDFSHMKDILSEGRRTINNIERSATLFLVKNIFSLLLAVFSIISVMTYPLKPSQITMISLFNIGIPGFCLAIEKNDQKITGNFLIKVLLRSMPAALTDFFAIAALVVFGETFNVASADISVAATFLLIIVGFIILINICSPLNGYRIKVILGCIIGAIFAAFAFNDLFSITYISVPCIMLFVLFAIATEPCMRYLTKLFEFIEITLQNYFKARTMED